MKSQQHLLWSFCGSSYTHFWKLTLCSFCQAFQLQILYQDCFYEGHPGLSLFESLLLKNIDSFAFDGLHCKPTLALEKRAGQRLIIDFLCENTRQLPFLGYLSVVMKQVFQRTYFSMLFLCQVHYLNLQLQLIFYLLYQWFKGNFGCEFHQAVLERLNNFEFSIVDYEMLLELL